MRLWEQPSSFCCMNESNFWFSAPPWTEQTKPSVDDIMFLDFLLYYILKATFVYFIQYETVDVWIWVLNNTNPAKISLCHSTCIKQSCVCTTAVRMCAHTHIQIWSRFWGLFFLQVSFLEDLDQKRSNISFTVLHASFSWEEIHCLCFWKALVFLSRSLWLRINAESKYCLKI